MSKTILLIDDESLVLRALTRALRHEYDVHTVRGYPNAALAAAGIRVVDPDAILCDYTMPSQLSGVEVLAVARLEGYGDRFAFYSASKDAIGLGVPCFQKGVAGSLDAIRDWLEGLEKKA